MTTLKVQKRNMEIKAKRLRREGFVTGNLFGHEIEGSIPIQIEQKEAERILRECPKGSKLTLELDGKATDVLLKELDYDSMKKQIMEMDFQALVKGEMIHCTAEIILHNKDKVVEGVLEQLLSEISYKACPKDIVNEIDVDCSTLHLGDTITVADLPIAKNENVEVLTHKDMPVVHVGISKNQEAEADSAATEEEK